MRVHTSFFLHPGVIGDTTFIGHATTRSCAFDGAQHGKFHTIY